MSEFCQPNQILEEIKLQFQEKDPVNQSSFSRIWSEISVSKNKEKREVIQIGEQKTNDSSTIQKVKEVFQKNETGLKQSQRIQQIEEQSGPKKKIYINQNQENSQQKNQLQSQGTEKTNTQQPKDISDYMSFKELFPMNLKYLDNFREFGQNQKIYSFTKHELFEGDYKDKIFKLKEVQIQAASWLLKNYTQIISKTHQNQKKDTRRNNKCNFIRAVDLLYKKYIVSPYKSQSKPENQPEYDIYKPDLIYCERLHPIVDQSIIKLPQSFKRNSSGRDYNDNIVSLVQNQSTNETPDYLESHANNYVNGMRRQKPSDLPPNTQNQRPSLSQPLDKFKKYGPSNSEMPLPFDIDLQEIGAKKQFHSQYNLFQSSDDDKSERFKQERMVAKTFVKDGYGLQIIRNYMGPSMDGGTYNRAITTIIRDSYKKIEDFLSKTCNIKIHCLTSTQFSLIKTPLVHCRNILKPQDLATFFKYVGISYNFGKLAKEEYPTAEETLSLYNAILRGLNDRRAVKEHMPRPNNHHRDLYNR